MKKLRKPPQGNRGNPGRQREGIRRRASGDPGGRRNLAGRITAAAAKPLGSKGCGAGGKRCGRAIMDIFPVISAFRAA
ncbi:MAG: hypothetical protein BAA00_02930 [Parageobacillus thermoglucosidasius]|nr:MAG: hypothetical protein BAA00_02930 [Parageobacillus thermoglucosidasius]